MKLFGRGQPHDDDDLDSNAGFEIGVEDAPIPPPTPVPVVAATPAPKGFFGRFRKETPAPEPPPTPAPQVAPRPIFSVQEYNRNAMTQPSIMVTPSTPEDLPKDYINDITIDMDDEELGPSVTKKRNMTPLTEEERRERWNKYAPWCILWTIILLIIVLLSVIFGLLNKDFGTTPPRAARSPEEVGVAAVTVSITLDDAPEEVGWKIMEQGGNWNVATEVLPGTYDGSTSTISELVILEWGKDYVFRITDTAGDGLSKGEGGSWSLSFRSEVFGEGELDYGVEDTVSFFLNKKLDIVNVTGW